jgi:hypothetical protein
MTKAETMITELDVPKLRKGFLTMLLRLLLAIVILTALSCCQKQEPRPVSSQEESSPTATPASANP